MPSTAPCGTVTPASHVTPDPIIPRRPGPLGRAAAVIRSAAIALGLAAALLAAVIAPGDAVAVVRAGAVPAAEKLPVVRGRPESCLACHRGMTGFSPAHRPQAVGCSACHGGDAQARRADSAHRGLVLVPGNLDDAARSCGAAGCHAAVVTRVQRSVMASFAGVIATDRRVFGEDPNAGAAPGQPPHARSLGHGAADSHLRQLCVQCHLGQPKTLWGPIDEESRGGGCNACHLRYGAEAARALAAYVPERPERSDGGAPVPPPPAGRPFPAVHPRLSVQADGSHCFGCHSRSSRISTSYEGWHELREDPAPEERQAHPERFRDLQDGRVFTRMGDDLHHAAGMDCIDCHTALEVMGSGHAPARKAEALRVRCDDCHAAPGVGLASRPLAAIDPEARRILALRGWKPKPGQRIATARSGDTLLNVTVDAAGRGTLRRKGDRGLLPIRPQAAACSGDPAHQRLACNSCHTAWAPRCTSCHTRFDPGSEGHDHLDWRFVPGEWMEDSSTFDAGLPTLGVRRADGQGERGGETIDTFVPGMIMTLDRNLKAGAPPDPVFVRLFAPTAAHTVRRASRDCASCHADALALGYGEGRLSFEIEATSPPAGRWRFTPREPARPQDGLPADAWTGFLATRSGTASTHDDARPFDVAEQRRILTVGACLTCHRGDSSAMRAALQDFAATLKRRSARCAVPVWD